MDILEYQDQAQRTLNKELDYQDLLQNLLLGLNGEVGELTDIYKKLLYHNHTIKQDVIEEEIGDVLWYILNLITIEGFSIEKILIQNIEKLKKRYPNGFNSDDSIKRVDVEERTNIKKEEEKPFCNNRICEFNNIYTLTCINGKIEGTDGCINFKDSNRKEELLKTNKEELPTPKLNLNNTNSQHYKNCIIEPFEYIHANKLNFFEGCIIKYVTRHKEKNGIEDLKKAKDYLNFLIENY